MTFLEKNVPFWRSPGSLNQVTKKQVKLMSALRKEHVCAALNGIL